jgi:hypothetical protein
MLIVVGIVIGLVIGAVVAAVAISRLGGSSVAAARRERKLLLDEAARAGYMVLGLEYVNTTSDPEASSVASLCARDRHADCFEQVRLERVTGEDASDKVSVTPANAIVNRIEKALAYLARSYPAEGWGAFLTADGRVDWAKLAVGGHSQGAGMAALLGKLYPLYRVCLFSGPSDFSVAAQQLAPWVERPGATPPERYYGVVHEQERGARPILLNYAALGLDRFGAPERVTSGTSALTSSSHLLVLTLEPRRSPGAALGDVYHGSTAADAVTPQLRDGSPSYRAAWAYVIGR